MNINRIIKIGFVQINNSFSNQNYLPYSVGILQSYAQKYLCRPEKYEYLLPIFSRIPIKDAVKQLLSANIAFFSVYILNLKISLKIAEELKKKKKLIIVFGGPQIPIIADESIQRLANMEKIKNSFNGINIKLMKCTGISEAYNIILKANFGF